MNNFAIRYKIMSPPIPICIDQRLWTKGHDHDFFDYITVFSFLKGVSLEEASKIQDLLERAL